MKDNFTGPKSHDTFYILDIFLFIGSHDQQDSTVLINEVRYEDVLSLTFVRTTIF